MLDAITIKIFADGADLDDILKSAGYPMIQGFTTNPTLLWNAGLPDYEDFAQRLLERITDKPISFEVFADDEDEVRRQAMKLAAWGDNAFDNLYTLARRSGCVGGKLVGAAGGGFLLVHATRPDDTRQAAAAGASELAFDFEFQGAFGIERT